MVMYLVNKSGLLLGVCVEGRDGWRFRPQTSARKGSRKGWPSATKCIPRWAFDASHDLLTKPEYDALKARLDADARMIDGAFHTSWGGPLSGGRGPLI